MLKTSISTALLAGAITSALATMASAAPLTKAELLLQPPPTRRSATALRSRARTIAPPARARPARELRWKTSRAIRGNSSRAAPAPRSIFQVAVTVRWSRWRATS